MFAVLKINAIVDLVRLQVCSGTVSIEPEVADSRFHIGRQHRAQDQTFVQQRQEVVLGTGRRWGVLKEKCYTPLTCTVSKEIKYQIRYI